MDNKPNIGSKVEQSPHIFETASELLGEGKKKVTEFYEESVHKIDETQKTVHEYSDELVKKVKENPLTSVLVAAGIGFILSSLLRK